VGIGCTELVNADEGGVAVVEDEGVAEDGRLFSNLLMRVWTAVRRAGRRVRWERWV
jgi:hypothetical protein